MKGQKPAHPSGFSLIELIVVVAVVGIVASISIAFVGDIHRNAEEEKLSSDTGTLNRAVAAYLASGGSLADAKTPADVLAKLKTAATPELRDRMPGFTSTMVDPRTSIVMQDASDTASDDSRVHWDPVAQRFVVASSGAGGVKEFILDDSLAEVDGGTETRDAAMLYAKDTTWVWDYQDRTASMSLGPETIILSTVPETPIPPASVPPGPPVVPPLVPPGSLNPPLFSIPGGSYGIATYPLSLALSDPNPPGVSKIIYAVDFGSWQDYGGSLSVSPDSTVSAQAVALTGGWSDSGKVDQNYAATPAPLTPPAITADHSGYSLFADYDITVTLTNSNPAGTSATQYRVDGGGWQEYTTPFLLAKADYPSGVTVEAQAISLGSPFYLDSPIANQFLGVQSLNLTGSTTGDFSNPQGPSGMVSNLAGGGSGPYFDWGDGNGPGNSKSWLNYTAGNFANVTEGVRFNVGSMDYYNGTIKSGSGAETIDLAITLNLEINGSTFNPYFDFTFELINTPNTGNDEWAKADYVLAGDPRSNRTVVIDDYEFEFRIEFGETSSDGFADFTEFHVLEKKDASVNVYGTLVSLGPVGDNDNPLNGGVTIVTDPGTGTPDDPLFQKDGYVDPLEHLQALKDYTNLQKNTAKAARDDAKDGADDASEAREKIGDKIDDEKFDEAAILAELAAAGAPAAEAAAQIAEAALVLAQNAKAIADQLLADYPGNSDVQKMNIEITALANETATYAAEARAYADDAAADNAVAQAIWDDFLTNGPNDDPEGFVEYLADAAKAATDVAKNALNDAEDGLDDAIKGAEDTVKKIDDGKYDEAREKAEEAAEAAALADAAAVIARTAAIAADNAATQAATIASTEPDAAQDAQKAADFALEADGYATEARTAADAAVVEATNAAVAIAALP